MFAEERQPPASRGRPPGAVGLSSISPLSHRLRAMAQNISPIINKKIWILE